MELFLLKDVLSVSEHKKMNISFWGGGSSRLVILVGSGPGCDGFPPISGLLLGIILENVN